MTNSIKNGSDSEPASEDEEGVAKRSIVAKRSKDAQPLEDVESESSEGGDVDENAVREKDSEATANDGGGGGGDGEFSILDDEEKWLEMQKDIRRQEKVLVTKSTETHVCYAPRFPGVRSWLREKSVTIEDIFAGKARVVVALRNRREKAFTSKRA